ncbi:MAG: GDSL-type esterase/lipase family protein [Actinomycetota bacterium]
MQRARLWTAFATLAAALLVAVVPGSATLAQPNDAGVRTLVFGRGSGNGQADRVAAELGNLGYLVDQMTQLPAASAELDNYDVIWHVEAFDPLGQDEIDDLVDFVDRGGSLYLTGERPCCEAMNDTVQEVANSVLVEGRTVEVGGRGDVTGPFSFNPGAVGGITTTPNPLAAFEPSAPGELTGWEGGIIPAANTLASNGSVAVGGVWSGDMLRTGLGRLVLLMDVNWLEKPEIADVVENIQVFLAGSGGGSPPGPLQVAILGDSYISGEGAFDYLAGTDALATGGNLCHRSGRSWAYQLASELVENPSSDILFAACSGATSNEVRFGPQRWDNGFTLPRTQLDELRRFSGSSGAPDVVFMSLGGNDALFSDVIEACLLADCLRSGWANTIFGVDVQSTFERMPRLAALNVKWTLDEVREIAPEASVVLMGYPSPVIDRQVCGSVDIGSNFDKIRNPKARALLAISSAVLDGARLDEAEQTWAHDRFLTSLNGYLAQAASEAGVHFVNPQDWFAGHSICTDEPFAHGITAGNDIGGVVGNESFHPSVEGYDEMTRRARELLIESGVVFGPNPPPVPTGLVDVGEDAITLLVDGLGVRAWHEQGGQVVVNETDSGPVYTTTFSVPVSAGITTPNADGTAEVDLVVPAGTPEGLHTFQVRDEDGGLLWIQPVLVDAPDHCEAGSSDPDVDGDGIGDWCDPTPGDGPLADPDGDGILNSTDNCPTVANPNQASNGGPYGAVCDPLTVNVNALALPTPPLEPDGDGDGVGLDDNCPLVANATQTDGDADGIGDACDPDLPQAPSAPNVGYWMVDAGGEIYSFGDAPDPGSVTSRAVGVTSTPTGEGLWVLTGDGVVHALNGAVHHGNVDTNALSAGEVPATVSVLPDGSGYWVFTNKGRALSFGTATELDDLVDLGLSEILNGPVLASVATTSGEGAYMIGSDGGVFALGDAVFHGSMGGERLNEPVMGIAPDPDGTGYWLVASDGGIFSFEAEFQGSLPGVLAPGQRLNAPVVGAVPFGSGYLMVASDGGVFNFSDQEFLGSLGDNPPPNPVTAITGFPR